MIVLILLAFAGMLAGIFLLLNMTPFEFAEDLTKSFASREPPISKKIGQLNHPRGAKGIQKTVREAKEMMILTGRGVQSVDYLNCMAEVKIQVLEIIKMN